MLRLPSTPPLTGCAPTRPPACPAAWLQVEEQVLTSRLSADLAHEAQQALEEGNGSTQPSDSIYEATESEEGSIRGLSSGPVGSSRLGSMALGSGPVGSGLAAATGGSPQRAAVERA